MKAAGGKRRRCVKLKLSRLVAGSVRTWGRCVASLTGPIRSPRVSIPSKHTGRCRVWVSSQQNLERSIGSRAIKAHWQLAKPQLGLSEVKIQWHDSDRARTISTVLRRGRRLLVFTPNGPRMDGSSRSALRSETGSEERRLIASAPKRHRKLIPEDTIHGKRPWRKDRLTISQPPPSQQHIPSCQLGFALPILTYPRLVPCCDPHTFIRTFRGLPRGSRGPR